MNDMNFTLKMNQDEINALNDLVDYVLANERTAYEEHLEEYGEGSGHIYDRALTINNWIHKGGSDA
jgi:hypothetical protein